MTVGTIFENKGSPKQYLFRLWTRECAPTAGESSAGGRWNCPTLAQLPNISGLFI